MSQTQFYTMPDGRRIAFRKLEGEGPVLVFLPGYLSDMAGSKAQAVFDWATEQGRACLLLDYSGCGESDGAFADGTLTRWREEVLALIKAEAPGPVVLVGSSMGGWLMLLCALALEAAEAGRVAGLVGIAAAPDFTDWGYSEDQKALLAGGRTIHEENPYGDDPTPTHGSFWTDGETHRLLDRAIALRCPVRLLHGQCDPDVPWEVALRITAQLHSDDVQVTLIKDGDHRLSRPDDIALLLRIVAALSAEPIPRSPPS